MAQTNTGLPPRRPVFMSRVEQKVNLSIKAYIYKLPYVT